MTVTTITDAQLAPKDYASDQEVRWCPGCGDYAILKAVQKACAEMGLVRERTVFVSGIGCAARFPYYMSTYGFHTVHGREDGVMIHPDDPDRDEAHREPRVGRPQLQQPVRERVAAVGRRHLDLEHEQRDGDREHAIAERLQPGLAHAVHVRPARRITLQRPQHDDDPSCGLRASGVA